MKLSEMNPRVSEEEAEATPREADNETLSHKSPGQVSPARTHGGADGHLPLPPLGPNQEEVSDVQAGDEKEEPHGPENDQKCGPQVPNYPLPQRSDAHIPLEPGEELLGDFGIELRHPCLEVFRALLSHLKRHSGAEPTEPVHSEAAKLWDLRLFKRDE